MVQVTEISTTYRYHPESNDMLVLCKQFEELLPTAHFDHKYVPDCFGGTLVMIEAWDDSQERYYSQVLRDTQEPEDIAAKFHDALKPRNPVSKLWLPPSAL